ncbi:MAG: hypothetical protein DRO06_01010 [Thermoproteota archaeon]|nr:MAG: hypothetical protein DRO06_01010 [Candidatus Korarchaeota archaeon]HDI86071.1 hypothetical protein [Candidatus Korarchaeota archaeon]
MLELDLPIDGERRLLTPIEAGIAREALRFLKERTAGPRGEEWSYLEDGPLAVWLIALLSDEALMAGEGGFRGLVDETSARGIVRGGLERLVLLSTWGTMPQMIRDLERAGKTAITYAGAMRR